MRILLAEDDAVTRRLVQAQLTRWGHDVIVCEDGAHAWQVLSEADAPRLAILDWMMPEMEGVLICRQVRSRENQPYVYIILLTSRNRKEDVIEGLESGADDYIIKPFDLHELRVRVRAGCRILSLQEQLISALSDSEFQASHDPLTGLWNRRAILDILEKDQARSIRNSEPMGVIVGDLDHFKRINDSYGHLAGDAVLREVARRITSAVRLYDSVGRYGGEEFLIVVPGCNDEEVLGIAERVRAVVAENPLVTPEGQFQVTMSLGVATAFPDEGCEADAMIRAADEAMYAAKAKGRNRVELWRDPDVIVQGQWGEAPEGQIPSVVIDIDSRKRRSYGIQEDNQGQRHSQ